MGNNASILITVGAKTRDAISEFGKLNRAVGDSLTRTQKFQAGMKRALVPAVAVLAGAGIAAKAAVDQASDLSESLNKTSVVFGNNAKQVEEWGNTAATAMGLAKSEALDMAANLGGMFQDAGKSAQEAAKLSQALIQRAADLGSMFNVDPTQASEKLQAALRGEYEGARALNIQLSDAVIKQYAYKNGIAATGSELTEAQKVQARYGVIMEKSRKAAGDFGNTSDGVANSQRIITAQIKNLQAQLGSALLPVVEKVLKVFRALITFAQQNSTAVKILASVVLGAAAAIVAINGVMRVWGSVTKAATAIQLAFNVVMAANPAVLVVAAVVALVAGMILLYKKVKPVRDLVDGVGDTFKEVGRVIQSFAKDVWDSWLKPMFTAIKSAVDALVALFSGDFSGAWDSAKKVVSSAVDAIVGWFTAIPGRLLGLLPTIGAAALQLGEKMLEQIGSGVGDLGKWILGKVTGMASYLGGLPGKVATAALDTGANLLKNIASGLGDLGKWIAKQVKELATGLGSLPKAVVDAATDIGKGIFNAIKNGIGDIASWLWNQIKGIGSKFFGWVKKSLRDGWPDIPGLPNPFPPSWSAGRSARSHQQLFQSGPQARITPTGAVTQAQQPVVSDELLVRALRRLILQSDARNGQALYI